MNKHTKITAWQFESLCATVAVVFTAMMHFQARKCKIKKMSIKYLRPALPVLQINVSLVVMQSLCALCLLWLWGSFVKSDHQSYFSWRLQRVCHILELWSLKV